MPHNDANRLSDDPGTWVDHYGDYLYGYALIKTGDPTVAEDLVQEALLAALKARKDFKKRSAVKTWLTAILKHKLMDYYRKKYRNRETESVDTVAATPDPQFNRRGQWQVKPGNWIIDPAEHYEQKEFMQVFLKCVDDLPPRQARAFTMREIDGVSTKEICKHLAISTTNCWVMLHRARLALRHCLELNWFKDQTGSP